MRHHDPKFAAVLELRAHAMRHAPTPPEARLWEELRGNKLGVAFRRQVPLGHYIADFVAPSVKLVVEVDGVGHARRKVADARRDERMRRLGYRVLRVQAVEVHRELAAVVGRVRDAVRALRSCRDD